MPRRKHNKLTRSDAAGMLVYSCCSTCSSKLYLCFSWNAYILRLSEIRPIPWFLTEDSRSRSTSRSIHMNEPNKVKPETNDRDYLSSLIVLQSYVRILLFVQHLVCKGHFRISKVPPYLVYSQFGYRSILIILFIKSWKTSAVSTTVGMVETQLCKLRGTSDTFV